MDLESIKLSPHLCKKRIMRVQILFFLRKYLPDTVSALLIFLFVYASVSKLIDHEDFTIEVGKSPLLTHFTRWVVWGIPTGELAISALLVYLPTRLTGLYFSFGILVLFTAYLLAILRFSFFIPCTCGGVLQSLNWNTHILFNCVFILLSAISILFFPAENIHLSYCNRKQAPPKTCKKE
jgi:hypothetical protein